MTEPKPVCACHDEPMRARGGGGWRCAVTMRALQTRHRAEHPELRRERDLRFYSSLKGWERTRRWRLKGQRGRIQAALSELAREEEACRTSLEKAIQTK